ncbi:rCG63591, partial [Rattus norvegicus]
MQNYVQCNCFDLKKSPYTHRKDNSECIHYPQHSFPRLFYSKEMFETIVRKKLSINKAS